MLAILRQCGILLSEINSKVIAMIPWNIYPRPRMKRDSFLCLNGTWDFCICPENEKPSFDEKIRVPYCPQSPLSGIHRSVPQTHVCHYRHTFTLPEGFRKEQVLLHFGAVDQEAVVYLNGNHVGNHAGGYLPFTFDITVYLQPENELIVTVTDRLDDAILPWGKQKEKRGGMWYTPVTGIWQTVWLESVPDDHIRDIAVETAENSVSIELLGTGANGTLTLSETGAAYPVVNGKCSFELPAPHLWSPEDPFLYHFTAEIESGDKIASYFALRTLTTETVDGVPRLCLNGKPYFFHGLLDQGYFPEGIFTPQTPEAYEKDILTAKRLGFNTLRKHIKIEPQIFYEACDRLGMIVFQDMVNNGSYSFLRDTALPTVGLKKLPGHFAHRSAQQKTAFWRHMKATVGHLRSHPSICLWTIFNEGWGQFEGTKMYRKLKMLDDTRFIDTASGWFKGCESDVNSPHVYFRPFRFKGYRLPTILSEFGGYVKKEQGHLFNENATYGYGTCKDRESYMQALERVYETEIIPAIPKGLCGSIYTQLTDVEDELNGLVTYDRQVIKPEEKRMRKIAEKLKI